MANEDEINSEESLSEEEEEKLLKIQLKAEEKLRKKKEKEERKKEKKKEKDAKRQEQKQEMDKKFRNILHEQFFGILDKGKIFYTVVFLVGALLIAGFSLGGTAWTNVVSFIALTIALGFVFLLIFSMIPKTSEQMFGEREFKKKAIFCIISFGLGSIFPIVYLNVPIAITWLSFSQLLPGIFIVVFFGWNLIQIHFVKGSFQEISMQVENKLIAQEEDQRRKNTYIILFLVLGLLTPLLLHTLAVIGFWAEFELFIGTAKEINFTTFVAWVIFMYVIILATDYWQIRLFVKSKKNKTPNVFSNMLYILFSILLWFRSFGFINTFRATTTQTIGSDIFLGIGNVFLLGLTSIMVLRGLAERVKKSEIFNEDSIPFLVYALTIMYVTGQVVMIQGEFGDKASLDMFNNSMLLITGLVYYLWYSSYILQREGWIGKSYMTLDEVKSVVFEFANDLKEEIPAQKNVIDKQLSNLLENYKLSVVKLVVKEEDEEAEPVEEEVEFESTEDIEKSLNEEIEEQSDDE